MKLYDNTRVSSHRECNTKFYYEHRRHWRETKKAAALGFGGAWHASMDIIWPAIHQDMSNENIEKLAYDAWCTEWKEKYNFPFYNEMNEDELYSFRMRHEHTAADMIRGYLSKRRSFIESLTLIDVEKPFAVPLDPNDEDLLYVGRLDKVVSWEGRIWAVEHKTTSEYKKEGYFKTSWLESFSPNSQIDGYIHALHMLYGKEAKGVLIDGALVHKDVHEGFGFVTVDREVAQLDRWLNQTKMEISRIEANDSLSSYEKDNDLQSFMAAFPQNTSACVSKYGPCPYINICKTVPNPESLQEVPMGYMVRKWEPFDELKLESIGVKPEETRNG